MTQPGYPLPWYATREEVKRVLDYKEPTIADLDIDRNIESASRIIDKTMDRKFYPYLDTRYFDWPTHQYEIPWRVWLDDNEMCGPPTQVTVSNGAQVLNNATDYIMMPYDALQHARPYTRIEINLGSQAAFSSGASHQKALSVTGPFGFSNAVDNVGVITSSLAGASSTLTVSNSMMTGVGALLLIGTEYMHVTGVSWVAATGSTLAGSGPLVANMAGTSVPVTTGTGASYSAYESITIDAEEMLIQKIIGDTLIVKRATVGTALAQHTVGAPIYLPRQLTVVRGLLGTTATNYASNTPIARHRVPQKIKDVCIAEAVTGRLSEVSGYSQQVGVEGTVTHLGVGLGDLWDGAFEAYARQIRVRTAARLI